MIIYTVFQYLLITGAGIFIGYRLLLGLLALLPQHQESRDRAAFNHSFLLVINLHHKEQEISKTLYSLYSLVYPSNLFDIVIITDDARDKTMKEARTFGAIILDHKHQMDEGAAPLRWTLDQLGPWEEKYDAIIILEPGGLVSGNFLEVMNHYLEGGSEILQSSNLKVAAPGRWRFKLNRTFGLLSTHINMLGRKKLGLGIKLMGNGMCFRTSVLKNMPIDISRIEGDLKSNIPLLLEGIRVDFVPEAVVWSYLDDGMAKYNSDMSGTETSRTTMIRKYLGHFLTHVYRNKSIQSLDTSISLLMPSSLTLLIGTAVMVILNGGMWRLDVISNYFFWIWFVLFFLMIIYLSIGIITDWFIFLDLSTGSRETAVSEY